MTSGGVPVARKGVGEAFGAPTDRQHDEREGRIGGMEAIGGRGLGATSLVLIASPERRVAAWRAVSGCQRETFVRNLGTRLAPGGAS